MTLMGSVLLRFGSCVTEPRTAQEGQCRRSRAWPLTHRVVEDGRSGSFGTLYPGLMPLRRIHDRAETGGMADQPNPLRSFERLDAAECWRLVGTQGVGRIGFMSDTRVQIVPARYDAHRHTIYFRAGTFGEIARRVHGQSVSLQVEDLDPRTLSGWSVVMSGQAHRVEDAATVAARWSARRPSPWLPSPDSQWIAVPVDDIQGERVLPSSPRGSTARS
jgi:nitroimidazol reductase NimA-like FMN-containing flavoprotein (pyridoxamine 5'-phosphate oxidase superfamily)